MGKYMIQFNSDDGKTLSRAHIGDAGIDIYARKVNSRHHGISDTEGKIITFKPGEIVKVDTGVSIKEMPEDHFIMLTMRSSMGKRGLCLANGVGIIDSGYHDSIMGLVINLTNNIVTVPINTRMFQMIIMKHESHHVPFKTEKRSGGFGSSGDK